MIVGRPHSRTQLARVSCIEKAGCSAGFLLCTRAQRISDQSKQVQDNETGNGHTKCPKKHIAHERIFLLVIACARQALRSIRPHRPITDINTWPRARVPRVGQFDTTAHKKAGSDAAGFFVDTPVPRLFLLGRQKRAHLAHEIGHVHGAHALHDPSSIGLHRTGTDRELGRDLLVGHAGCNELQHLALTRR